ncbi:MAG: hypothetical protein K2Y16_04520 [Burkholderiales bacterium]|nr:hypothetical protein [Burkholderiales bacterium]
MTRSIRLFSLLALLAGLGHAPAALALVCNSTGTGLNWGTAATWTCGRVPTNADNVNILAGHIITMNGNPGTALSLTISGTANWAANNTTNVLTGGVTINAGGNIAGTANGVLTSAGGLTINAVTTSTTVTVILQTTTGQTISGAGTLARLTVNTTATNTGTLTVSTALAGSSTLTNTGTLNIGGTSTITGLTANTAVNTVNYSGAAQTIQTPTANTYHHLQLAGSGTKTLPATAMTIAGDLTVSGTATANTGNALTVNGNVNIGSGTTFDANTYTHNFKGNLSNSGTLTGGTSTVNFNGTVAQSISGTGATNFFSLTIANAAGVTLTDSITVRGNFTNTAGFTAGTGTVTFGGSSAQSLTGSTTFNNLTMNNAAGLTLNNTVSVGGTMTFTGGNIATGANALVITPTGSVTRTSGHVVGNLTKHFTSGTSVTQNFEIGTGASYTPVTVTIDTVTAAGSMTATTATPDHPQIATAGIDSTKSVNRYWTLSKDTSLAFTTFGAVFNFVSGEVDAGANTANFIVQRYAAPTWFNTTLVAPLATSTEAANIRDMGDFAIGQPFIVSFSREKEFVFTRELY